MSYERFKHLKDEVLDMNGSNLVLKISGVSFALLSGFWVPIIKFLLAVGALIIFDFLTGAWKSRKRKIPWTSRGMYRTVEKMVLYTIAILASYIMEWVFISGDQELFQYGITYVTAGFIAATELKSIMENVGEATGIDLVSRISGMLSNLTSRSTKDRDA